MQPALTSPGLTARPKMSLPARRTRWLGAVVVLLVLGTAGLVGALGPGAATQAERTAHLPMAAVPTTVAFGPEAFPAARKLSAGALADLAVNGTAAVSGAATGAANGGAAGTGPGAPASGPAAQSALIEETGTITLVVRGSSIAGDTSQLMAMATASGGFVAGTETQSATPGSPAQGTVTLQVPERNFDALLGQVRSLGKVSLLTTSALDVTGQYVDLQARITALEDSRRQYLTIMAKATTVGGILAVQEQLDSLQSELEQLQGQLRVLDNQTTYATLTVTLTERAVVPPPPKPETSLAKAWDGAVSGFVAGFEGMVRVAGPLLFAALLLAALYLLARGAWRARRRHAG